MASKALRLARRVAVVTGGGSGIGRAICQRLSREGASVFVIDRDIEAAQKTALLLETPDEHYMGVDVTRREEVTEAMRAIMAKYSMIDILVNCAGITRDGRLSSITEDMWNDVVDVNLKGTFLCTQAAAEGLHNSQAGGSIINVSSLVGRTGNFGQSNYAASKGGVIGLTKSLARELGPSDIRCNVILPGFIKTPMTKAIPDKVIAKVEQQIPLGRLGEADDIAATAAFLASDDSKYITGAAIEVTGGLWL